MRNQKSCTTCRRRKQKCDQKSPCSRCILLGVPCKYLISARCITKIRPPSTKDLIERIKEKENKLTATFENLTKSTNFSVSSLDSNSYLKIPAIGDKANSFQSGDVTLNRTMMVHSTLDYKRQLFETFFSLINKIQLIVNEESANDIFHSVTLEDEILLNAILAISLPVYNHINSLPRTKCEDNIYYKKASKLSAETNIRHDVKFVQALILLSQFEMSQDQSLKSSLSTAKAIRICQTLGFHELDYDNLSKSTEITNHEGFAAWSLCITLDRYTSIIFNKPPVIAFKMGTATVPHPTPENINFDFNSYLAMPNCKNLVIALNLYIVELYFEFNQLKKVLVGTSGWALASEQIKEIYNQLQSLEKLPIITNDLDTLSKDIDFLTHSAYLVVINFNLFRFAFLCDVLYSFHRALDKTANSDHHLSAELLNESRKYGLLVIRISARIQERLEIIFSSDQNVLFYLLDLIHMYNLEVVNLPFISDTSKPSQKIISDFKEIVKSVAEFWPLYSSEPQHREGLNI